MPDDGIGTKPQYVPYFDREAMQLQSQVSDVLLVSQLLATCKKQAGAYLDGIPTLKNIPGDVVSTVTKQLLEKGWHLRLFAWLQRIRADAPELVSENLMVIADGEYWGDIPDGELPRDRRKREIFQERYEAFVRQAISDVELRGQWDQDLQLAYAYFQKNVAHDEPGARRAFQGAFRHDGRMEAVVPYARMLVAKKHVRFAKKLLLSAWKQHGDVEALKMLTVLEFETKNSNAALQHYQYLQIMREEPKAPLAALLQDFEFPRDFDALEAIGSKWQDLVSVSRHRVAAFEALAKGAANFESATRESMEYGLRALRLGAIEYRNYGAAAQFVTQVISMYEGWWEKRDILLDFFRKYPLPRITTYLETDEDGERIAEIDPQDPLDMEEILSAHLFHAIKFALSPDRHELVTTVGAFAKTHGLDTLGTLVGDMDIIQERFQEGMFTMGDEFVQFYQDVEHAATELVWGEENYYGILCAILEWKFPMDAKMLDYSACQLAFTMASIIYGGEPEDIETMLQKMDAGFLTMPAADHFGRLLRTFGYEKYALANLVKGDIRNRETISMLLELVFTEINTFDDLREGLALRTDNDPDFPIDLRVILRDMLKATDPQGEGYAETLTLCGEAAMVYGAPKGGLRYFERAAKAGSVRAKLRIAEHHLYQDPFPARALKLLEEVYAETKDVRYLADIARARQSVLEESRHVDDESLPDNTDIFAVISKIPQEHPSFLPVYVELSLHAKVEYFDQACAVLANEDPENLELLSDELLTAFSERAYYEIDRIKASRKKINTDQIRLLTYSRMLLRLYPTDIEYALDYAYDLLSAMEKLIPQKRVSDVKNDSNSLARAYGRKALVEFLSQFHDDDEEGENDGGDGMDADGKPAKFEYHVMDYDENGEEAGIRETITDPFALLVLRELLWLEELHRERKKLLKLYEMGMEIFATYGDSPILAWEYENKRTLLLKKIEDSKPKRLVDQLIQNSATRLQ